MSGQVTWASHALHVKGGYSGWANAGLEIQEGTATYKATVLDSLTDEAEAVVEATTSYLRYTVLTLIWEADTFPNVLSQVHCA